MRLIIDTDTAGDDTYSLLLAMRTPGSTLEAVTICVGNVPFDQQVENALATIEVAGFSGKVPVYLGARRPMVKPWEASTMHGNDGMSGANLPIARQRPETMHAVDAIIERVMAEPGEIDILAQAPLTNIALAVMKEPRIAKAVRHLWIMGGTDNAVGNITPCAEYNFFIDPEAARIVFEAGFDITLSTWTLTMRSGLLEGDQLDEIFAMQTPLSEFYRKVSAVPRETAEARYGRPVSTHPDSLTCACALDPDLIESSREAVVRIETSGEITRGFSAIHPPKLGTRWPEFKVNARVIEQASTDGFLQMMKQAFAEN
ncbi:nucleoside hydrolase [Neorhizobium galegae]|uniref:nucleoside hydrolase n=1 Tax=Neorhizobium galegae TaxID=399 RepID=UPI0006221A71|nr:nucleoside hydrolase [Neorhizobium galegae]CDZ34811.1 Inosine-uridine preferring nucleoside hydrolase [Neorhizobium galegae bv. officinalis]KAA9383524.1 nucleoside hydrolase [Neorhizobium galegae]KAB1111657.1 nucleoside hydrolase [Neorhizobium galegae]MCM2500121.1 nucleoside hydrolase [Neorhizobium galegae]MCQ1768454.1 nucleoside hydrolase [Neorhizobium galegae]